MQMQTLQRAIWSSQNSLLSLSVGMWYNLLYQTLIVSQIPVHRCMSIDYIMPMVYPSFTRIRIHSGLLYVIWLRNSGRITAASQVYGRITAASQVYDMTSGSVIDWIPKTAHVIILASYPGLKSVGTRLVYIHICSYIKLKAKSKPTLRICKKIMHFCMSR